MSTVFHFRIPVLLLEMFKVFTGHFSVYFKVIDAKSVSHFCKKDRSVISEIINSVFLMNINSV